MRRRVACIPTIRLKCAGCVITNQIEEHKLLEPVTGVDVNPALLDATGAQEVSVKLKSSSFAMMANDTMSHPELVAHKAMVENEQISSMERTGTAAKEITCVPTLMNAAFLNIDASEVALLALGSDAISIHRVMRHYEMQLSESVPYIGAKIVQNEGCNGTGVRVAVLDSGIKYTHAAFGGEDTQEA